jgi:hypothetical protein
MLGNSSSPCSRSRRRSNEEANWSASHRCLDEVAWITASGHAPARARERIKFGALDLAGAAAGTNRLPGNPLGSIAQQLLSETL